MRLLGSGVWYEAFCTYNKDPSAIARFIEYVEKIGVEKAIDEATQYIKLYGEPPDGVTLGFSPQVLVAASAARRLRGLHPGLHVVTSPEVYDGLTKAAEFSHRVLNIFGEQGLVRELYVAHMSPTSNISVELVVRELVEVLSKARSNGVTVLDISGGTQLVPIAAVKAGFGKLTYTYPDGKYVVIYEFNVLVSPT